MRKQLRRHPDLTVDDYRLVPAIADAPTMVFKDGLMTVVLVRVDGETWRHVAVKTTGSGRAAFVTSYRFTTLADVMRLLRKKGVRVVIDRRN